MMKQPDWGMGTKKISQFDWPTGDTSFHGKQISVHFSTHEGACCATDLLLGLAP